MEMGSLPLLHQRVIVVGYPVGGDSVSVTAGVVSRIDFGSYSHSTRDLCFIQIDAAINSGNSGGPAFHNGKVVGIAFQTLLEAEVRSGCAFAALFACRGSLPCSRCASHCLFAQPLPQKRGKLHVPSSHTERRHHRISLLATGIPPLAWRGKRRMLGTSSLCP